MANEAKSTTIDKLCDQGLLTAPDHSPGVGNAIAALDGALLALGSLKVPANEQPSLDANDVFTLQETRQCIDGTYRLDMPLAVLTHPRCL